jgi:hypothetical protein
MRILQKTRVVSQQVPAWTGASTAARRICRRQEVVKTTRTNGNLYA